MTIQGQGFSDAISQAPRYSSLSPAEVGRIFRDFEWPSDLDSASRALAARLAEREAESIVLDSYVAVFASSSSAIEVRARAYVNEDRLLAVLDACGADVEHAHASGQFFAVRQALIGERGVCGILMDRNGIRVKLEPTDNPERYQVIIEREASPLNRRQRTGRTLAIGKETYILSAVLEPRAQNGRTRYLRVTGLHQYPDLKARLRDRMRIDGTKVRLHRLVLALAGFDMRARETHGHHINGIGYDCRLENLRPSAEHRRYHRRWASDLHAADGVPYVYADEADPYEVTYCLEEFKYQAVPRALEGGHTRNRAAPGHSTCLRFLGYGKRRDRKRSLDRVVIALRSMNGRAPMVVLVHALSDTSCDSVSGIRKVLKAAEEQGIVARSQQGRSQQVMLQAFVPAKFALAPASHAVMRDNAMRRARALARADTIRGGRRSLGRRLRRVMIRLPAGHPAM